MTTTNRDSEGGTPAQATTSHAPFTTTFIRVSRLDSNMVRLAVGLLAAGDAGVISSTSKLTSLKSLNLNLLQDFIQSLFDRLCQRTNLQRCKITFEALPDISSCYPQIAVLTRTESGFSVSDWTGEPEELQYQSAIDGVIASMSGSTNCPVSADPKTTEPR